MSVLSFKSGTHEGAIKGWITRRMGGMAMAKLFEQVAQPDGGFTYQPLKNTSPKTGYVLSVHPERSFMKSAKELTLKDLKDYALKNVDLLEKPENHLGAWNDPATGNVFLDVSTVIQDESKAAQLARDKDQIAYFDLGSMKSVTVNREATSGGVVKGDRHGEETGTALAAPRGGYGRFFAGRAIP